uniref:Uncharacterized protein n=1 Tax=Arundo donax TaxID=35708 RepID=A0A0A8Z613_ARUDO
MCMIVFWLDSSLAQLMMTVVVIIQKLLEIFT